MVYPKVEVSWDGSVSPTAQPDIPPRVLTDKQQPHMSPIVIHLPHLTLYFPPSATQALAEITLSNFATQPLTLTYDAHVLCSPTTDSSRPQTALTRGLVGRVLGPTYDSKGSAGQLVYPGIAFHVGGRKGISGGRDEVMDKVVISAKDDSAVGGEGSGLLSCVMTVSDFSLWSRRA